MKAARSTKLSTTFLAIAALATCGGDSDNSTNVFTPAPTSLSIIAGTNDQTGAAGTVLLAPLSVRVVDQNGNAASGATVSWSVGTGGGTLAGATSITDGSGTATMKWTLPSTAGRYTATASVANGQAAVTFNATATAATATSLILVSGNNQSLERGGGTEPFIIKAVDAQGNAVAGVPITWATTGGGRLSVTSGTTGPNGQAQVTLTTSPTAGAFTVTASSGTLTPIVFNGTAT